MLALCSATLSLPKNAPATPDSLVGPKLSWRDALLTAFAPGASPHYVSTMRARPETLGPLAPYAAKYLELIELSLTGSLLPSEARSECHPDRPVELPRGKSVTDPVAGTCFAVNTGRFNTQRRLIGRDWPTHGLTMVGHARLRNVRHCIEHAIATGIPGDFVELGVWRGGASIYARAVLNVLGQHKRSVRLFDAFGLIKGYGAATEFLAVTLREVKANFETYGLEEGVRYHAGLFNQSLPSFYQEHKGDPNMQVAVLRIDGNFYESYQDALYHMWDFVPVGGFVIFDDFVQGSQTPGSLGRCWADFKRAHGLTEKLLAIDWSSSFFQKATRVKVDWRAYARDRALMQALAAKSVGR
tara:strand:+ start:139 stop:1206 length:1068 start_codon:yes stop_codon:yes gene_type:complete